MSRARPSAATRFGVLLLAVLHLLGGWAAAVHSHARYAGPGTAQVAAAAEDGQERDAPAPEATADCAVCHVHHARALPADGVDAPHSFEGRAASPRAPPVRLVSDVSSSARARAPPAA